MARGRGPGVVELRRIRSVPHAPLPAVLYAPPARRGEGYRLWVGCARCGSPALPGAREEAFVAVALDDLLRRGAQSALVVDTYARLLRERPRLAPDRLGIVDALAAVVEILEERRRLVASRF